MSISWERSATAPEINTALDEVAGEFHNGGTCVLRFRQTAEKNRLAVKRDGSAWLVEYEKTFYALRGAALAAAGAETEEETCFDTHGILLDCSRNPVITPERFKHWLRKLALLGYNTAMLYTKDAYQLPGETYFGYMRGAYSVQEMKEVDSYAKKLGVEMVASIQALGHLEPVLRWPHYARSPLRDTDNVLMVDAPESYALLEKMIGFWAESFSSSRIHLGMDETHDLGRGRFMDKNGYENPFHIYNRHLRRLCTICKKHGLSPIIWNDMYFRYGNKSQSYYGPTEIPDEVKKEIPPEVQTSYWDYYHYEPEIYAEKLTASRELNGHAPLMASAIRTWPVFWTNFDLTKRTVRPCLEGCRRSGTRDIIYTMWGDDGGFCEFESVFSALAWAADCAFHGGKDDEARAAALYRTIFGADYFLQLKAGEMEQRYEVGDGGFNWIMAAAVMWDDPLMGIVWHEYRHFGEDFWEKALAKWRALLAELQPHRHETGGGDLDHACFILEALTAKVAFRLALLDAYRKRDLPRLTELAEKEIPQVQQAVAAFEGSFRKMWFRSYKSWGLEIMQIKLAGLRERYTECGRRIRELVSGRASKIEELELAPDTMGVVDTRYRMNVTGSWFI